MHTFRKVGESYEIGHYRLKHHGAGEILQVWVPMFSVLDLHEAVAAAAHLNGADLSNRIVMTDI